MSQRLEAARVWFVHILGYSLPGVLCHRHLLTLVRFAPVRFLCITTLCSFFLGLSDPKRVWKIFSTGPRKLLKIIAQPL